MYRRRVDGQQQSGEGRQGRVSLKMYNVDDCMKLYHRSLWMLQYFCQPDSQTNTSFVVQQPKKFPLRCSTTSIQALYRYR